MNLKNVMFIIVLFVTVSTYSQSSKFGINVGYNNLIGKIRGGGNSVSDGSPGFFISLFNEFKSGEKFYIQPEIGYAYASEEGVNINQIIGVVLGKYYFEEKFNIQAGPFADYVTNENATNRFGLGLAAGVGYDISNKVQLFTRYSFALTNRATQNFGTTQLKSSIDFFQIGLGYRF